MIHRIPIVFEVDSETGDVSICRPDSIDPSSRTTYAGMIIDTIYTRTPMGFKAPLSRTLAQTRDDIYSVVKAVLGYGN